MRIRRSVLILGSLLWLAGCGNAEKPAPIDSHKSQDVSENPEPAKPAEIPQMPTRPKLPEKPRGFIPSFTDVTEEAGIAFERYDDMRGQHRILEVNGGGVALFDYDADGLLDVFFANGCKLPLKKDRGNFTSRLYRNLGDGRFEDVTEAAGLIGTAYCQGVAVGDDNSDGFDDLYVNCQGENAFWRNNGDGTFTNVIKETGTDVKRWGSSAAWTDFDQDGHLDLYVVNYVQASDDPPKLCPDAESPDGYTQCPPTMFPAADDVLFLSDGRGGFRDATLELGITGVDGKGLGIAVFDFNRDGRPDIYVANDGMPNFLYVNRGESAQPRFENQAGLLGASVNLEGKAEASMGVACGDYDADGWPDLLLTHFYAETNTLYHNLEGQAFLDQTIGSGLGPSSRLSLGFGTEFFDAQNNGRLDLLITNGHIDDMRHKPGNPPYAMRPQLYRNEGGRFLEVSAWAGEFFQKSWIGRGLAVGDWDNDGDVDAVITHQKTRSAILRNDSSPLPQSILLKLVGGRGSNRSAVNAVVETEGLETPLLREVIGGGSFQSSSDRRVHLGLGDRTILPKLKITWPSGQVDEWPNLPPGSYIVQEGRRPLPVPRPN